MNFVSSQIFLLIKMGGVCGRDFQFLIKRVWCVGVASNFQAYISSLGMTHQPANEVYSRNSRHQVFLLDGPIDATRKHIPCPWKMNRGQQLVEIGKSKG